MSLIDAMYYENLYEKEEAEKNMRKRPYRWLNRSTMTEHNEECGKCHFVFHKIPQYFPYCPMCGEHLLPCYKRKEGDEK